MRNTNAIPRRALLLSAAGLLLAGCAPTLATPRDPVGGAPPKSPKDLPQTKVTVPPGREVATIAGGCFWCVEAIIKQVKGVDKVVSGYSGGAVAAPTYEQVCAGETGHAEAIQITFDPKVIPYGDLLRIFLTTHDPTTLNRQGADVGTQYRSAIFYHSPEQKATADKVIRQVAAEKIWRNPIVTEVTAFANFYAAEEYHQDYYARNQSQGYCQLIIAPKVLKFRQKFAKYLK